jgi:pyruvyltransferase
MASAQPLSRIRKLRGGTRVADRVTGLADGRNTWVGARIVRRIAGFPARTIPLYWFGGVPNFGDALSAVIVEAVSNGTAVPVSRRARGKVLAVGSILDSLNDRDSVWGSGLIRDEPITPPRDVTFHAVRGPLTRERLRAEVPEIYGDPAMLLPRFYTPRVEKRFAVGLVPHFRDRDAIRIADPSVATIDVQSDWRTVVDRIAQCETILSSSLHGLIVAEAYGIPAGWMVVTGKVQGEGFKFRDYYLSTSREALPPLSWDETLRRFTGYLREPPHLDVEPLLKAWPRALTFSTEPEGDSP